ncbi:PspC domain-containing protein [Paenibacillus sp. FSL R5-0527]|uniref:PspC domain-containing protein n=1 Tax=Paenibacillus TaxID=44249 RepID=UPI00097A288C|nr:PspC domain-containing protein [Paenibacillus macerans]MED4957570.1 PspC domain-containing protein [Paenibacillus macerans]OMG47764.1 hypothetical protein BK140_20125 [Paenibacillus macerans]
MNKLYRSRRDRWISGLLGGLGEYLGVSSWVLRLLMLISIPITGGTTVFIYFIAALVVSKEPYAPYDPYYNGGWPGGGFGPSYGPRRPDDFRDPRFHDRPPYGGGNGGAYGNRPPQYGSGAPGAGFSAGGASNLDSMMEDIEKKAMQKELEELRKKLSNYEKGEV